MSAIVLTNILNNPNGPNEFLLIALMMLVLLCKLHSANLIVPLMALLVFAYNFSLGRMGIMLPDGVISKPGDLLSAYIQSIAVFLITLYGMYLQS